MTVRVKFMAETLEKVVIRSVEKIMHGVSYLAQLIKPFDQASAGIHEQHCEAYK